ncbi:MAG: class II aldolase/adducin family protein [Armatimonadota bacterium]|nr:class II aldolase/adducin family protein [bacterium]MDW8320822.1 class II aldolase/adducin family protein [Armatimonadota bacterium]
MTVLQQLVELSRWLGAESRELAILGEGNTSALAEDGASFYVKASGTRLMDIDANGFVQVDLRKTLHALEHAEETDEATRIALESSRVDPAEKKMPSVETFLHAYLLSLPGVRFVGHTHPVAVNALLCSQKAEELIAGRLFPDEIVVCGIAPLWVPYTDPGLPLARELRQRMQGYVRQYGVLPKVILMQNHGLIAPAETPQKVIAATAMYVKTAKILLGTMAAGGPNFLEPRHVERIYTRPDEAYRQQIIAQMQAAHESTD